MYQYYADQAIRDYVERTFAFYDVDHSQTLDLNEFTRYIHDWYANHGTNIIMTPMQAQQMMKQFDPNFDGHITKQELHNAMARMGSNPQPYVTTVTRVENYQHVNSRPPVVIVRGKTVTYY